MLLAEFQWMCISYIFYVLFKGEYVKRCKNCHINGGWILAHWGRDKIIPILQTLFQLLKWNCCIFIQMWLKFKITYSYIAYDPLQMHKIASALKMLDIFIWILTCRTCNFNIFVGLQACMASIFCAHWLLLSFVYIESFWSPFYYYDTISEVRIYYWMFKHMFITTFPMSFQAWLLYELEAFCCPTVAKLKFEISLRIAGVSTLIPNLFSDCMKSVCWKYISSLINAYNDFEC